MYCYPYPHPAVTTDVVVFTIRNQQLNLLLVRRRADPYSGCWALPGGFVGIDEDLEACAVRELHEETGVTGVYLEQLCTSGAPTRDPRERVISVAYYTLIPEQRPEVRARSNAKDVGWFPVLGLPPLAFDHKDIVERAHKRLAAKLEYSTIALQLMPMHFTLSQLQRVHEVVLSQTLDKRNFRKRMLALDCIEEDGGTMRQGKHRPAKLYRMKSPGIVEFIK